MEFQVKINASTDAVCGSGRYDTNVWNCLLSLEANKSVLGDKFSSFRAVLKSSVLSIHSEVLSFLLDSKSATKLSLPGTCAALNPILPRNAPFPYPFYSNCRGTVYH